MEIRQATTKDYPEIYQLVKEAFKTAQVADGNEQDFVEELRSRDTYLSELELVAVDNHQIVGHVMLSEQPVKNSQGDYTALLLAPLAVEFNHRNQGVGTNLMKTALAKAAHMDKHAVFLVGSPAYYERFGFQSAINGQLKNASGVPDQFVLGKELVTGMLSEIKGELEIH